MGSSQSSANTQTASTTQSTTSEPAPFCCGVMDGLVCCGNNSTPKTTQVTPSSPDATQEKSRAALFRNHKKKHHPNDDDDATVTSVRSITSLFRRRRKNKSVDDSNDETSGKSSVLGAKLAALKKRDTKSPFVGDDDDAIQEQDTKKSKRSLKSKLAFKKKGTADDDDDDIETKGSETTRSVKLRHKLAAPAVALAALAKRGKKTKHHEADQEQVETTKKVVESPAVDDVSSPTDPAMLPESDGTQQARQEDHVAEEHEKKKKRSLAPPKFLAVGRRGKKAENAAGENEARVASESNSLMSDNVANTEMKESKAEDLTPEAFATGDNPPTNGWMCCNFNLTVVAPV